MLGRNQTISASRLGLAVIPFALVGASASAVTSIPDSSSDPMRFFEGTTESISTVKVIMRKPYRSKTIGDGDIERGVLNLVQRVHDEGKEPYNRRWKMRQVAPGRFSGSMSEAAGPVLVEQVGDSYRFRFKMNGNLAVEQWLTPLPGGSVARSKMSVRRFGIVVGRSEGTVRKI